MFDFLRKLANYILSSESGQTLNVATKTNLDAAVPEYWDRLVMDDADRKSITGRLTGRDGSDAPILEKMMLTKQRGDKITFTVVQRLIGAGVSGTTTLEGAEEKLVVGVHTVTVQLFRHATAFDEIADTVVLFSLPGRAGRNISNWLARFLDDKLTNRVINQDTIQIDFAGAASTRATLGDGDVLLPNELQKLHMAAERRGVMPFRSLRTGQLPFPVFGTLLSEVDYYNLAGDDTFEQDFRHAALRGGNNPALSGYTDMYKGNILWRWSSVNPGDGMLGSFLRPEARLATTVTTSGTTISAGPTTAISNVDYWQYFPTSSENVLKIGTEEIKYTATPGNRDLVVSERGANGTTAFAHQAGALITLRDVGKVLLFGQNFAMQAWAKRPGRIRQERDYAMERGIGIRWIYEVKGVEAADGTLANAVLLETTSPNPNTV